MAVTVQASDQETWSGGTSTETHTITGYTATADDYMIVLAGAHRADRSITSVTDQNLDNFTLIHDYSGSSGQVGAGYYYKKLEGDETSITINSSGNCRKALAYVVLRGVDTTTPIPSGGTAEDETNVGAGTNTSQATGTATFASTTGMAVYGVAAQEAQDFDGGFAVTPGTIQESMPAHNYVGCGLATEALTSDTTANATFSSTGTGADTYGCAVVFSESGGAPASNPKGPLGHPLHGPLSGPVGPL